jgi:hypothetical protein
MTFLQSLVDSSGGSPQALNMGSIHRTCIITLLSLAVFVRPSAAKAEPTREFVLSCTYGVLAGTLVGAASLAFSDKPGDNLNKVARGASLGLYAGILLGLYVIYGVPSGQDEDAAAAAAGIVNFDLKSFKGRDLAPATGGSSYKVARSVGQRLPRVGLLPIISERGLEGAQARWEVLNF